MGQPTHAFDLDKIEGGIIVRRARKGEKLKTLDGIERTLDPEDLVVADHVKPLGLAGVMGGWDTMITPETKNVLVEAAWFEPMAVRRTARRHGLHTDASHRFERGADFNAAPVASAIVSRILLANGGHIEGDLVDVRVPAWEARTANRQPITLALSEVHRILGKTEDKEGITAPLRRIHPHRPRLRPDLATSVRRAPAWQVRLPSWRLDLEREIDLIEEVARVYGYNRFANTLPAFGEGVQALAVGRSRIRQSAAPYSPPDSTKPSPAPSAPLQEAALTAPIPGQIVPLGNPLSEEAGVLRPSLVPGTALTPSPAISIATSATCASSNSAPSSAAPQKKSKSAPRLAFAAAGNSSRPKRAPPRPSHRVPRSQRRRRTNPRAFSDAHTSTSTASHPTPDSHPHGCTPIAPRASSPMASPSAGSASCIRLKPPPAKSKTLSSSAKSISTASTSCRCANLPRATSPASSPCAAISPWFWIRASRGKKSIKALASLQIPELVDWRAREVFRDARLGAHDYSLLVSATFQAPDRTLREEELQSFQSRVVEAVSKAGARLRT